MKEKVYENIIKILKENEISYEEIEHEEVKTTDDSKRLREENTWSYEEGFGSKNIIFHAKENFYLVVTKAEKNIKAKKFKKEFGTKNIRFAYGEEIASLTACEVGAIPSFGYFNKELPIYFDEELFTKKYFMFNPALHNKSIRIKSEDMKKIYTLAKNSVKYFSVSETELILSK